MRYPRRPHRLGGAVALLLGCNAADRPESYREIPDVPDTVSLPQTQSDANVQLTSGTGTTQVAADGNTETVSPAQLCPAPSDEKDFFGLPRCCHTKAKLCEDFEAGSAGDSPDPAVWKVLKAQSGVVEISQAQAARGKQSLHLHADNSNGEQAMVVNQSAFPFPDDIFWGRAFVFFNSPHPNNHTTYVAAGPSPNPSYQWLRYSSFGNGTLGGNDSDPDNSSSSRSTLAQQKWSCIEWHYDPSAMKAYYYLDGALISTLDIDGKHKNTTDLNFGQVEIGWEIYTHDGDGSGWDLFVDEIALNDSRIGCAN